MRQCVFRLLCQSRRGTTPVACTVSSAAVLFRRGCHTAGSSSSTSEAVFMAGSAAAAPQSSSTETVRQQSEVPMKKFANKQTAQEAMDLAAAARRDVYDLWRSTSQQELKSAGATEEEVEEQSARRVAQVASILEKYKITPTTSREENVCRGLGDAFDHLLLLCIPLDKGDTTHLERVLQAAGSQGRQLSIRTVQHAFARAGSFVEALAIFYALRRCHVAMNMEAYHAMLYSLQRLEEEGWAQRFHEEYAANKGEYISEQALDFVLRGVDNQLLPENKPWLGRIMFADSNNAAATQQTPESFDSMGKMWVQRYKSGSA